MHSVTSKAKSLRRDIQRRIKPIRLAWLERHARDKTHGVSHARIRFLGLKAFPSSRSGEIVGGDWEMHPGPKEQGGSMRYDPLALCVCAEDEALTAGRPHAPRAFANWTTPIDAHWPGTSVLELNVSLAGVIPRCGPREPCVGARTGGSEGGGPGSLA